MAIYKFRKKCRLCSSTKFNLVLDLGKQPPSNAFLTKNQLKKREKKFPLRLYVCKKCFHLQLRDVVDKKYLFSNYPPPIKCTTSNLSLFFKYFFL